MGPARGGEVGMRDECEATGGEPALRAIGRCMAVLLPEPEGQPILLHDTAADPALRDALGGLRLRSALWRLPEEALGSGEACLDAGDLLPGAGETRCAARVARRGGLLILAGWAEGAAPVVLRGAFDALDRALDRCAIRPSAGLPPPAPAPFEAVFENAAHCMAVIGAGRRLIAVNRAGRRVLAEGRLLLGTSGQLCAADPGDDHRLGEALSLRGRHGEPCTVVLGGVAGRAGLRCEIGRINLQPGAGGRDGPRFFLTAVPIAASAPIEALLADAFGLTGAEARLAAELVAGRDLRAAGERMGVSHHTARKYLQIAFSKMGVRRQADLVRLALQLAHGAAASAA